MKKFIPQVIFVLSIVILLSCSGKSDADDAYYNIAGTYKLVALTSNYPVDFNADGKYETHIFPFVRQQSCISSIELTKEGQGIWNYLDYFGGIGIYIGSGCELAPSSKVANTCRLNDGVHGLDPAKYKIISSGSEHIVLADVSGSQHVWLLDGDSITFTKKEPLNVAYQYEGKEYANGFSCSPGNGIYLTYTFKKQ